MDRSWFTTFSMYCSYAGNTLMLKKGNHRFAVDLCTYYRRESGALRAHVHHGHDGPGRQKDVLRRRGPVGVRQDHDGNGRERLRRRRPCADVDRRARHAARGESRGRDLRDRGRPEQGQETRTCTGACGNRARRSSGPTSSWTSTASRTGREAASRCRRRAATSRATGGPERRTRAASRFPSPTRTPASP